MVSLSQRVLVMASGSGTTFEALVHGLKGSQVEVVGLIASRPCIGVLERAETLGVRAEVQSLDLVKQVKQFEADLIVLAGYLKKLSPEFLAAFNGKVINVHPSLLPKFGGPGMFGRRVHEAVKAAGEAESGASVHWVTENYDEGPIIDQARVSLNPEDDAESIEKKVRSAEKELLVAVVKMLLSPQP